MKVWELMEILSKFPAGADVKVSLCGTMYAEITEVCHECPESNVLIDGGDTKVIDSNGNSMGWLSTITDADGN